MTSWVVLTRSHAEIPVPTPCLGCPSTLTVKGVPFPVGHGYAISPVALYPKARGTLRLANPDPAAAPLIDPKFIIGPGLPAKPGKEFRVTGVTER